MLDAYIIEQIRRDQERKQPGLQPLRIEVPRVPEDLYRRNDQERRDDDPNKDRGVVIIDYTI